MTGPQLDFLRAQIEPEKIAPVKIDILEQKIYLADFCNLVDLDPRRVQQLKKEGRLIDRGRGKYFLSHAKDYIQYLQELVQRRKIEPERKGDLDPNYQRARKEKAMADKIEMENDVRRGELVDAAEHDKMNAEVDGIVRSNFLALAPRLASDLAGMDDPREIQVMLDDEIRRVLSELGDS